MRDQCNIIKRPPPWGGLLVLVGFLALACEDPVASKHWSAAPAPAPWYEVPAQERPSQEETRALRDPENLLSPPPAREIDPRTADISLRVGVAHPIPDHPHWLTEKGPGVKRLESLVHSPLAYRDPEQPDLWIPGLAQSILRSNAGHAYTITLKPGLRWQNPDYPDRPEWLAKEGNPPLTSHDFAFALKLAQSTSTFGAEQARAHYAGILELRIVDDRTFNLFWDSANLGVAERHTMGLVPIPQFIYSKDQNGLHLPRPSLHQRHHWYPMPVGAGPYQVAEAGPHEIHLVRFPFFQGPTPPARDLQLVYLPEEKRISELEADHLDRAELSPTALSLLRETEAIDSLIVPTLSDAALIWNLHLSPTYELEVRQALSYALDRERISQVATSGLARVRETPIRPQPPTAQKEHAPSTSLEPSPFNLVRAAALLDEAGWKLGKDGVRVRFGAPLEITLHAPGDERGRITEPLWRTLCQIYAQDLARIGVRLNVEVETWSSNAHITLARWTRDWEEDPYPIWHSSQVGVANSSNLNDFSLPAVDQHIEELRKTETADARRSLYTQLDLLLLEALPYTFLFDTPLILAWRRGDATPSLSLAPPHHDLLR